MWPNPQFPADLVTFTEEILNGKRHFLCSDVRYKIYRVVTFTPKQLTSEVNHSRIIDSDNNPKPSGFIFYVETITYLNFFDLQDFTLKTRKE